MGKSTISMAIFNSYVSYYQRVCLKMGIYQAQLISATVLHDWVEKHVTKKALLFFIVQRWHSFDVSRWHVSFSTMLQYISQYVAIFCMFVHEFLSLETVFQCGPCCHGDSAPNQNLMSQALLIPAEDASKVASLEPKMRQSRRIHAGMTSIYIPICLVVTGTWLDYDFHFIWLGCHPKPIDELTPSFFKMVCLHHQPGIYLTYSIYIYSHL